MKPNKAKKNSSSTARARMFLRHKLGWVRGYPLPDGRWQVVPEYRDPVVTIALDSTLVRSSMLTLNKLTRDFPRALPRLVGKVSEWRANHENLLERIKTAIKSGHNKTRLDQENLFLDQNPVYPDSVVKQVKSILRQTPEQNELVAVLSWYFLTTPDEAAKAVRWLSGHSAQIQGILRNYPGQDGTVIVIRLWQLGQAHGLRYTGELSALLGAEGLTRTPVTQVNEYLHTIKTSFYSESIDLRSRPEVRFHNNLSNYLDSLLTLDPKAQKRSLVLFNMTHLAERLSVWVRWWRKMDVLFRDYKQLHRDEANGWVLTPDQFHKKKSALYDRLVKLISRKPIEFYPYLFSDLVEYARQEYQDRFKLFQRMPTSLRRMKPDPDDKLDVEAAWFHYIHYTMHRYQNRADNKPGKLNRYINSVCRYLNTGPEKPEKRWRYWQERYENYEKYEHNNTNIEGDALNLETEREFDCFFSIMARLVEKGSCDTEKLASLVPVNKDCNEVWKLYQEVRVDFESHYIEPDWLELAHQFSWIDKKRYDYKLFNKVLAYCIRNDDTDDEEGAEALSQLSGVADRYGFHDVLRLYAEHNPIENLTHLATVVAFIRRLKSRVPTPELLSVSTYVPVWARHYPKELHYYLKLLAKLDQDAPKTAERLSGKYFFSPEKLAQECEVLEARYRDLQNNGDSTGETDVTRLERMATRIRNLRARLENPDPVGPDVIPRLQQRLEQTVARASLRQWRDRLLERARQIAASRLGLTRSVDRILDPGLVRYIVTIYSLAASIQKLAWRIIKTRLDSDSPADWDFRTVAPNRRFIERMQKKKINMDPWIDGLPGPVWKYRKQELRIEMEQDPFEIFAMGHHFGTCLSPGGINYFSVFANAADINKRVLYCRNQKGKVLGRVLIAMSDTGGILRFHRYQHDSECGFSDKLDSFLQQLAEATGCLLVDSGPVSTLVAKDWYDDGPVYQDSKLSALDEGSVFRQAMEKVTPDDVVGLINKSLRPGGLSELTLPWLLKTGMFAARPELVPPLLLEDVDYKYIGLENILSLFDLARTAGAERLALDKLVPTLFRRVQRTYDTWYNDELTGRALVLLAEIFPAKILRFLEEKHGIRKTADWSSAAQCAGLRAAAIAAEKLYKPGKLLRILKNLLLYQCDDGDEEDIRSRIAELEMSRQNLNE